MTKSVGKVEWPGADAQGVGEDFICTERAKSLLRGAAF
jgi:hypothetical protein